MSAVLTELRLIKVGGRYVARCHFDQRHAPKGAGFRWDGTHKQWWTASPETAYKLLPHADDEVRRELEAWAAAREASLVASRAATADIQIPAPAGREYLPYQRAGIAYAMARTGVLIGDDMGLGKTIQAIGTANADPQARTILIICPASLKLNWAREWTRWDVKGLTVGLADPKALPATDVVICNYEQVSKLRGQLDARAWDLLIVDECHYLKNPDAQRTQAVFGRAGTKQRPGIEPVAARRRVFLTGTPVVNRPIELWPLVKSLDPQGLGASWFKFVTRYCKGFQTSYGWDVSGASNLDELQERLRAGIMVRRTKAQVLTELPPKRRQIVVLAPETPEQRAALAEEAKVNAQQEAMLERLRVAAELAKTQGPEEYERAAQALAKAQTTAFTEISKVRHGVALAKVPAIIEAIRDAELPKLIVMAHHQDVVDAILAAFPGVSVSVTGTTPIEERQQAVDRFQGDPGCTLFVGTIRAAGVGLTLTAASTVLFAELDWTPGNVTQAEDRAHRIGQSQSVLIQHYVLDGSLDARMVEILIEKQFVIDRAMDKEGPRRELQQIVVPAVPAETKAAKPTDAAGPIQGSETPAAPAPLSKKEQMRALAATLTPEQITAIHECLRILAGLDADGASIRNDIGFNGTDTRFGRELAMNDSLTPVAAAYGLRMIPKYHRQLPSDLLARAKGEA